MEEAGCKKFSSPHPRTILRLKPYKVIAKRFSKKVGFALKLTPCPIIHSEIRVSILSLLPAEGQRVKMANYMDSYGQNTKYSEKIYFMKYFSCEKHEDTVGLGAFIEL